MLKEQISTETADESSLSGDEVPASLDVLVSPDESSEEDDPPSPLPPPPQETKSRLKNNIVRRERFVFIFSFF